MQQFFIFSFLLNGSIIISPAFIMQSKPNKEKKTEMKKRTHLQNGWMNLSKNYCFIWN